MTDASVQTALDEVGYASGEIVRGRERARDACVQAVRSLEFELVKAVGDVTLRGLPNLAFGVERCFGLRVRGSTRHSAVVEGERVLVVDKDGMLCVAEGMDGRVVARPAQDADLVAEDVEDVSRCFAELVVREISRRHREYAERSTDRYERLTAFAGKVLEILRA